MTAVYKHELSMHFKSMSAYLFSAFILLFAGIYVMMYNLNIGVANFEYAIADTKLVYVIVVPLMTMRTIVQEKNNKTDQLLYSLPLKMRDVVLGKYLALVTVLALPMAVLCVYPLVLKMYGSVYLPQAYSAIAGLFLLGCALIAIGMFISSITESQIAAAGISFAVMLLLYMLDSLAEYIPVTANASYYAATAAVVICVIILDRMVKDDKIVITSFLLAQALVSLTFWFHSEWFEGLLGNVVDQISLFERFEVFTNGLFDLTGVVYLLSVASVFVFLTVQSMEKRRWS